jgi:serine/threonine protein kinase
MAVRVESKAEPIPGYRLIERLGGGGFGEVWRAEAPGGIHKAIKFVFGDLSSAGDNGQRAEQELKALSRVKEVRHPYILSLERYDIIDGQLMIVMELADRNLWDRYKECRAQGLPGIPRDELLSYMEESAEALDLMNSHYQLQHLDIKPQNLFLVHQHVKVADFGLVKDLEGSHASVTGGITPVYAAPETFDGKVSRHSDQYSLAILYQELLTGVRPFSGVSVRQLILQHLQAAPNVAPLPPADRPAIARALAKIATERFPTCKDLVRALRQGCPAPVPPADPGQAGGTSPDKDGPATSHLAAAVGARPAQSPPSTPPANGTSLPAAALAGAPVSSDEGVKWHTTPLRGPPDTGADQGVTPVIRAADAAVLRPAGEAGPRKAPPEINGPGALFPAVVLGLGQVGMAVLQRLREHLHAQVGPAAQLSNLRLLLLDTDPEVMRSATRGAGGAGLTANEVLLAPLNRPSHYLKPRDGRPPLDAWLNPRMLYRIPRSQVTTGVRALGRLAFCDNYCTIVRRLQMELDLAVEPAGLQAAARQTGLGLRTNRPRVYVVGSLGGGTAGGMFLDAAYTLRALLRQMGYDPPDVVGLLLLPPADGSRTGVLTLGNAFAALTELNYFARPGTSFTAHYHEREARIRDDGPPFSRCVVQPLPDESDEVATQELIDLCAQYLYRDVCSPLGRVLDLGRAGLSGPAWESRGLFFQTFGLFQLTWPRQAVAQAAARRLCQQLVQRWMSKDAKPLREPVREWVAEQWMAQELGPDSFIGRTRADVERALGGCPEDALTAAVTAHVPAVRHGNTRGRSWELNALTPQKVTEALEALERLVGRPGDEGAAEEPPVLVRYLHEAGERLTGEWGQKLAEMSVALIETPEFRLAGAEEAIRQVVATIEQVLRHHEPLTQELAGKAADAYARLRAAAAPPRSGARRPPCTPAEVLELLHDYPKWRLQSLVLQQLAAAFLSLRGHLSDELREVNFCRVRLGELARLLGQAPPVERPAGLGRRLFAGGCKDLAAAVEQFLAAVTADDLLQLDGKVEEMLKEQFTALVHVCLSSKDNLKSLEAALLKTAGEFAAARLPATDAAALFLEQHPDPAAAQDEVAAFFDEAAPELAAGGRKSRGAPAAAELAVMAVPDGPAGERFRTVACEALPDVELHHGGSAGDVLLYRERSNLALAELEQLGPLGRDAYLQMTANDHFTPHTRLDVAFKAR